MSSVLQERESILDNLFIKDISNIIISFLGYHNQIINNKKEGYWIRYFDNKNIWFYDLFKNNELSQSCHLKRFCRDGYKLSEYNTLNRRFHGIQIKWDSNRQLIYEKHYEHGLEINSLKFKFRNILLKLHIPFPSILLPKKLNY